ncbi:hypothetical protein D4R54_00200 [archaeon]|nr:MAG: hypothetical protein D4R54_00200 [archaeon]
MYPASDSHSDGNELDRLRSTDPFLAVLVGREGCFRMAQYHLRRSEKALDDPKEIEQLLASVRIMTVACCSGNEPYLFTVDFAWDPQARELWFHCATEGRKIKILQANPRVCVTVVEDRGYMDGECDHAYRSLVLEGKASVVTDLSGKRRALELLARKHERQPEAILARFAGNDEAVRKVGIVRVSVDSVTGKQGPAPKK